MLGPAGDLGPGDPRLLELAFQRFLETDRARWLLASAAERGERATGVVLSGMGADGAGGLAEIARRGGRALCQAPASAVVPSMPESALRKTPSALALPPLALPAAIAAQAAETSGAIARR